MIQQIVSRDILSIMTAVGLVIAFAQEVHADGSQATTMGTATDGGGGTDCTPIGISEGSMPNRLLIKALADASTKPEWAWTLEQD